MRRITIWAMSTLSGVVLLMSYPTSRNATVAATADTPAGANAGGTGSASAEQAAATQSADAPSTTRSGSTPTASTPSSTSSTGTRRSTTSSAQPTTASYTGSASSTPYGDVVVRITVTAGKVTKSEVTQVPWDNGHDQRINGEAVPILNQEAVAAQSSRIDAVSGATFTSAAYTESLQSALDQAHI